jgi:hypothetical protein
MTIYHRAWALLALCAAAALADLPRVRNPAFNRPLQALHLTIVPLSLCAAGLLGQDADQELQDSAGELCFFILVL